MDALGPLLCRVWCEASEVSSATPSSPHRRTATRRGPPRDADRPTATADATRAAQRGNRTRSALVVSTMHKRVSHMYTTELQSYRYPPPNSHGHSHARHTGDTLLTRSHTPPHPARRHPSMAAHLQHHSFPRSQGVTGTSRCMCHVHDADSPLQREWQVLGPQSVRKPALTLYTTLHHVGPAQSAAAASFNVHALE